MQTTQANQAPASQTQSLKLTRDQIEAIMNRLPHCAAKGLDAQYQSILEGVHFKTTGRLLEVCATDGSRLVYFKDDSAAGSATDFNALIPAKALQELKKQLRKKTAGDVVLGAFKSEGTFTIGTMTGSVCVEGKLIDGEFPRYKELFPTEYSLAGCIIETKELSEHCERVSKLCKALDYPGTIRLGFSDSEADIKLSMIPSFNDIRKSEYTTGAHYSAAIMGNANTAFSICFSPDYLADVIKNTDGMLDYATNLDKKTQQALKPVVFSDRDARVKHLLMPIQSK